jgi:hypothetical protein
MRLSNSNRQPRRNEKKDLYRKDRPIKAPLCRLGKEVRGQQ